MDLKCSLHNKINTQNWWIQRRQTQPPAALPSLLELLLNLNIAIKRLVMEARKLPTTCQMLPRGFCALMKWVFRRSDIGGSQKWIGNTLLLQLPVTWSVDFIFLNIPALWRQQCNIHVMIPQRQCPCVNWSWYIEFFQDFGRCQNILNLDIIYKLFLGWGDNGYFCC